MENHNEKHISEFMLSEYEHISNAHFESGKSINSFFRYYLLIMSAPAFIFLIFDKKVEDITKIFDGEDLGVNKYICFFFIIISFVGYFIFMYIVNKKMEVILYARTVNGIRNYFKTRSEIDVAEFLVLPTDVNKPSYFKLSGFYMMLPIGIINSVFLFISLWIVNYKCLSISLSLLFLITHIISYTVISINKNNEVK